ncbi:DUF1697 domain-containing protein [Streptococcus merionis]|uniref:Uncharacterized protein conserved in bacteria n=1 Tax=Streptococcus merionis TaxID=400065 RepID=A0A239T1Q5_9STRE|nr:DUF1697 domain-containing protein [Streptococcus merionis]SNU90894.1 Uncharacterized protein conserved in bacteria [Streptococcus merionis]
MKKIILLRGVTPTGRNRIPKMAYLAEILTEAGFDNVQTYIQSGNVILETALSDETIRKLVHDTILEKIGADLSVIIKTPAQLEMAFQENPFDETYDLSRIHLVFTNDDLDTEALNGLSQTDFGDETFVAGSECLYLYLPRDAKKKRLNTNFLEKQLGICMTMRKLSVIKRLSELSLLF